MMSAEVLDAKPVSGPVSGSLAGVGNEVAPAPAEATDEVTAQAIHQVTVRDRGTLTDLPPTVRAGARFPL